MLVITRKTNESFFIGENVEVKILDISGDKAKIGIYAPRDIKIMRSELLELAFMNKEAAAPIMPDVFKVLME